MAAGTPAFVSECCVKKLTQILMTGVSFNREYDFIPERHDPGSQTRTDSQPKESDLESLRNSVASIDKLTTEISRKAGLQGAMRGSKTCLKDSSWKRDDAAWFSANPDRSHRVRRMLAGEEDAFFGKLRPALPPGHEFWIMVRQVEPGRRVRTWCSIEDGITIPDNEAAVHALFDRARDPNRRIGILERGELEELANIYATGASDRFCHN